MQSADSEYNLFSDREFKVFLKEFWGQRVLKVDPGAGGVPRHLMSLDEVDYLIASLTVPDSDWIQIVRDGNAIDPSRLRSNAALIDLAAVYRAFSAGYTIQLAKTNRRHIEIGRLCRNLELQFLAHGLLLSHHTGGHVYLSPSNVRGLPPHYDDHDVIIVQIEGSKHWKIYGCREPYPVARQTAPIPQAEMPSLSMELDTVPGTILYIPRGWFHEAVATNGYSLHLSISIYTYTYLDLLNKLVPAYADFRRTIPPFGVSDTDSAQKICAEMLRCLFGAIKTESVEDTLKGLRMSFADKFDILPDSGFSALVKKDRVGLSTKVRKSYGLVGEITTDRAKTVFRFDGNNISAPVDAEPAIRYILSNAECTVSDVPGHISDELKIDLIRQLIDLGFLRVIEPLAASG